MVPFRQREQEAQRFAETKGWELSGDGCDLRCSMHKRVDRNEAKVRVRDKRIE